jgi:hypothetical protein
MSIEPRTPIERLLCKHLPYELDMLEQTLARLQANANDTVVSNALIESFWTHARNLIEFFTHPTKGDGTTGTASALDMTTGYFPDTKLKEIDQLINQQITHLQYDRPAFTEEQLDFNEMFRVRADIQREVERFQKTIIGKYQEFWKLRPEQKEIDNDVWLKFVASQPTATNVVTMVGGTVTGTR